MFLASYPPAEDVIKAESNLQASQTKAQAQLVTIAEARRDVVLLTSRDTSKLT